MAARARPRHWRHSRRLCRLILLLPAVSWRCVRVHLPQFILKDEGMSRMYLPVIRADLSLEETYEPPAAEERAGVPIVAIVGIKPGRDKEATRVAPAEAAAWLEATTSRSHSRVITLEASDWYVLQDEAGVRAVFSEVRSGLEAV